MVHDSKKLLSVLDNLITTHVTMNRRAFEVSDAKRDGTVFVRFRSQPACPAATNVACFVGLLEAHGISFTQPNEAQVRLPLEGLRPLL